MNWYGGKDAIQRPDFDTRKPALRLEVAIVEMHRWAERVLRVHHLGTKNVSSTNSSAELQLKRVGVFCSKGWCKGNPKGTPRFWRGPPLKDTQIGPSSKPGSPDTSKPESDSPGPRSRGSGECTEERPQAKKGT